MNEQEQKRPISEFELMALVNRQLMEAFKPRSIQCNPQTHEDKGEAL